MKIIIDIPEYLYKEVVNDEEYGIERMRKVVINGTLLPKEHGDLIDSNRCSVLEDIKAEIQTLRNCSCSNSDGIIDDVEDIIDKYKTESEK